MRIDQSYNITDIQCTYLKGRTTAQEINMWKKSATLHIMKTNVSSRISSVRKCSENRDKIFIFITTLGCIGLVLLTAHLIVYIVDRRRRSLSLTTTCVSIQEQGPMYENINDVSLPVIE